MEKLTNLEYAAMCYMLRAKYGNSVVNTLHKSVQKAFGTVDNVVNYYPSGLVVFANGERWIFNFNLLYPTFYRVDENTGTEPLKYLKAY